MAGDFSSFDWSWSVRLANSGYSAEAIFRLLRKKPSGRKAPYSLKYLRLLEEKGPYRADAYARQTAEKAVAWVKANPPIRDRGAAVEALVRVEEAAEGMDWSCRPGARRALEGLFIVGERLGSVSFALSDRSWAEMVGMTRKALRIRRDELVKLEWVRRVESNGRTRSTTYAIQSPEKPDWLSGLPQAPFAARKSRLSAALMEQAEPGSNGHRALSRVSPPVGTSLISRVQRLGPPEDKTGPYPTEAVSNRRAALALDAFRPSALGDSGWYALAQLPGALNAALSSDLFDRLAKEYGTAGAGDEDRRLHRAEREAFGRRTDAS